jgi:hypothetical protein
LQFKDRRVKSSNLFKSTNTDSRILTHISSKPTEAQKGKNSHQLFKYSKEISFKTKSCIESKTKEKKKKISVNKKSHYRVTNFGMKPYVKREMSS